MINPQRHLSKFDPDDAKDYRIDIIGVGATGSRIALNLARLGLTNFHVWDDDVIETHNVANQDFNNTDIGKKKVHALQDNLKNNFGVDIVAHDAKVTGDEELGDVVFILTDTMDSRKVIFEEGLKFNPRIKLVIETRMEAESGRIYMFNPCNPTHIREWESTLYSSEEAVTSLCGTRTSVVATAELICGYSIWNFIYWCNHQVGKVYQELSNEIIFSTRPYILLERQF